MELEDTRLSVLRKIVSAEDDGLDHRRASRPSHSVVAETRLERFIRRLDEDLATRSQAHGNR